MPDSETMDVISKVDEVDPVFREVMDLVFGDAVDVREAYDISKMGDPSECHVPGVLKIAKRCPDCKKPKRNCKCVGKRGRREDFERRQAQVGLASNALGITAGAAGLAAATRDERLKDGGKFAQKLYSAGKKIPKPISSKAGKTGAALAVGAIGLQAANLGGDVVANRVLAREAKKKIHKALDDIIAARREGQIDTKTAIELSQNLVEKARPRHAMTRAQLIQNGERWQHAAQVAPKASKVALGVTAVGAGAAGYALGRRAGKKKRMVTPLPMTGPAPQGKHRTKQDVGKADLVDYVYSGEISKTDDDKRLVFGWCNLSTVDGAPVVDLQGDYAPIEEIEKSAYAYVVKSRVGGDMHSRDGEKALHVSDMVESFVATPDKLEQIGVPAAVAKSMPTGWWVGYHVTDENTWRMVKTGERAGFSIHGKGSRVQKSLEGAA